MSNLFATYNTKTEADTFVRVLRTVSGRGFSMWVHEAAPGQYQVWERV